MDAKQIARTILAGFDHHYRLFRETSAAAKDRFERSAWDEVWDAVAARIDMYDQRVREAVARVTELHPNAGDERLWAEVKTAYIGLLYEHRQPECAETFYNSVASRVLDRRYHGNAYIFSRPAISTEHIDGSAPTYRCFYPPSLPDLGVTFAEILASFDLNGEWQDLERDADRMMAVVALALTEPPRTGAVVAASEFLASSAVQVEVLRSLFFRNKGACAIGRVQHGGRTLPFVCAILKDEAGRLYVDALLVDKESIGRVLSLGRAYFMVDMEVPAAYVDFLQTVAPTKPRADLYTMVGLQKQGKTLFFRDLQQHLKHSSDHFVLAPGTRGMVMLVFCLPSFPYVFKIIRDWFEPPKDVDRAVVVDRYQLVKHHDRVGRLTDALEYTHVAFPRDRFDPTLLAELQRVAPTGAVVTEDQVVIKHLYVERRLAPLDVFLSTASETTMRAVIREFGNAIRDLGSVNIFPGDLLPKNFGVTRYGRVIFYDYDEICYLTDCRFRSVPTPRTDEDEMAAEPWFNVGPTDVFPEQFPTFLFPEGPARTIFVEEHPDLADPAAWRSAQERVRAGEVADLVPYAEERRFGHGRS